MTAAAPASSTRQRWAWYASYYRGTGVPLTASLLLSVGQSLIVLPMAWLMKRAFDEAIPARDTAALGVLVGEVFALYLLNIVVTLATRHLALTTTKRVIARMRVELIERLYALPRRAFHEEHHSRLHNAIVQDTERVDVMSNALLSQVAPGAALAIALCGWLWLLNPTLFALTAISLPLALLANRWLGRQVRRHVSNFREEFEGFSGLVWQALRIMDLTRVQAAEDVELARQARAIEALRATSGHMAWLATAYSLIQAGLSALTGLLILLVGGSAVARGAMTLGDLVSFYVGTTFLATQTNAVLSAAPAIITGDESLKVIVDQIERGERGPYTGQRSIRFSGAITVERVSFAYDGRPVLRDLSFTIPPHTSLAIVGPNGSGKSTLAHLLLGFYRPDSGRLLADAVPFDEIDMRSLRRGVGVVMQDPPMLNASVAENISYGVAAATRDQIVDAARGATADRFIADLERGYDTMIGENGVRLSGGQRQQVALARALLGAPALLLLDEPTNHLDAASVIRLLENLKTLPARPTIVMTTHDPRVAASCEGVLRLEPFGSREAVSQA